MVGLVLVLVLEESQERRKWTNQEQGGWKEKREREGKGNTWQRIVGIGG